MDVVHDRKKEEILCPKCGDLFHSKAKLGIHIAQNHKTKATKVRNIFYNWSDAFLYVGNERLFVADN